MFVFVGLGNPGKKYEDTRHNAGYMFVDAISEFLGFDRYYDVDEWGRKEGRRYMVREGTADGDIKVLFCKPLVFMNESGIALREIVQDYNVRVEPELVLAHDDLDIELGKFKLQAGVSPKDHKGVQSVELLLAKKDFMRIRLGVDNRGGDRSVPGDEYVLQRMEKDERETLNEGIAKAVKHVRTSLEL